MAKIFLRKSLTGLIPADVAAEEYLNEIPLGKVLSCEVRQPRNVRHHQKYWAMLQLIFKNQEYFASAQDLHTAIKIRTGYCRTYKFRDGTYWHSPASIAFDKMDQGEFENFYSRALDFICAEVIPGIGKESIRRELEGFVET